MGFLTLYPKYHKRAEDLPPPSPAHLHLPHPPPPPLALVMTYPDDRALNQLSTPLPQLPNTHWHTAAYQTWPWPAPSPSLHFHFRHGIHLVGVCSLRPCNTLDTAKSLGCADCHIRGARRRERYRKGQQNVAPSPACQTGRRVHSVGINTVIKRRFVCTRAIHAHDKQGLKLLCHMQTS